MHNLAYRTCAYYALTKLVQHIPQLADMIVANANVTSPIESSKSQAYTWLTEQGVRIPASKVWSSTKELLEHATVFPCVVKQDTEITLGLQTTIVRSRADFAQVLQSVQFTKSRSGLVQEFVSGSELTVTVLVGVDNYQIVGVARDFKKQFENNTGLNTSGLGSVNVVGELDCDILTQIDLLVNLYRTKYNYRGFLSCQFIVDANNTPWLMECNNRLCSPEFQSLITNLPANFADCVYAALNGDTIPAMLLGNDNSVTIGLLHSSWPAPQAERASIDLTDCPFVFNPNLGKWDFNCYLGTITHSGNCSHVELAKEIYQYLDAKDCSPYRYRKDIAFVV